MSFAHFIPFHVIFNGKTGQGNRVEYFGSPTIPAGTLLWCSHIEGIQSLPSIYTIQVSDKQHVLPRSTLDQFINHSCDPNVQVTYEPILEQLHWTAIKPISCNDEVCFDYETTEARLSNPFDCVCGSVKCRGRICGKQ